MLNNTRTLRTTADSGAALRFTFGAVDGVLFFRCFVDGRLMETSEGAEARRDWRRAKDACRN